MKIIFILMMILSLCSCNKPKESNTTMIANPFVDCQSLQEAQTIAGFSLSVPNEILVGDISYRVLNTDEKMIEIIVKEKDETITLRKSMSKDDISGLYFDLKKETTINIKNINVTLRGFDESYVSALWRDNNYSYSLYIPSGRPSSYFEHIVSQIK